MNTKNQAKVYSFLQGGGDTGQLIRQHNWTETPIGSPDGWPQPLRTTLGILLNSSAPSFLLWGKELICFFNDAFGKILGDKSIYHKTLGKPGLSARPDVWALAEASVRQVLSNKEGLSREIRHLPGHRDETHQEAHYIFSYSPVFDESGEAGGVFATCMQIVEQKQPGEQNDELAHFKLLADNITDFVGMCDMDGKPFYINQSGLQKVGLKNEDISQTRFRDFFFPEDLDSIL
ncbi:MAG TPA: PAS domain-containing protein, partial [Flavisolibacter sp.]|nr:PAS domain-containing protein [Flavisolibacter sp.]